MRASSVLAAALVTVGLMAPATSGRDHPEPPDPHPWIAHTGVGPDGQEVRLVRRDGTGEHRVAQEVGEQQALPDWSPDGQSLVLATGGDDRGPAYLHALASGTSRRLFACTDACLGDDDPAFSPDGRHVAVVRALEPLVDGVPTDCGIWIGDVRTGRVTAVTRNAGCRREHHPRWSPDGQRLVHWRWNRDADGTTTGTAVFVVDADGTHERRLTQWDDFFGDPDWSPDGQWIVLSSHPLRAFNFVRVPSDLFRIRPDGSGLQRLTHYRTGDFRATTPRYTPDGRSLLFTVVRPRSRELWTMPADGGRARAVTTGGVRVLGTMQPQLRRHAGGR